MARTVLIVDDDDAFRMIAGEILNDEGFTVTGQASDGAAGLREARRLRPDVVLLDVQLPELDGFAVARLLAVRDDPPVVVLTSIRDASAYAPRLAESPARGFIPKGELTGAALTALVGGTCR